VGVGHRRRR